MSTIEIELIKQVITWQIVKTNRCGPLMKTPDASTPIDYTIE